MSLSGDDKRRIEEEEHYREQVRHEAKVGRNRKGCLTMLAVLAIMGILLWIVPFQDWADLLKDAFRGFPEIDPMYHKNLLP
ncbi:hypothetical protein LCGC14_1760630 [marine sediment metagenome]|uniref:Uncharacterized protein n=1 Tax=marine sediment metagenome TaxID=412755 RepID=A0A0F9H172_9ZZZZ